MKIFVCGPFSGDCLSHNIAYTLKVNGHDVYTEPPIYYYMKKGFIIGTLLSKTNNTLHVIDFVRKNIVFKKIKEIVPELVIVGTNTFSPQFITDIRKYCKGPIICWYCDSPSNIKKNHIVSNEYDAVFVKDYDYADNLRNILNINAHKLDEACNPYWHKPSDKYFTAERYMIAGTMYGYRERFVNELISIGVNIDIYGPKPPRWCSNHIRKYYTSIYLNEKNKSHFFYNAKGCFNSFAPAERESLNCRIFETCGSGGLLITEEKKALSRCFEPNNEILQFKSIDELKDIMYRIDNDKKYVENVRKNAAKRAHLCHTYEHRLREIFKVIEIKYENK